MADNRAEIEVVLLDKISKQIEGVSKAFKNSATEINSKIELMKTGWAALSKVVGTVSRVFSESIRIANENIAAENRLLAAMQGSAAVRRQDLDTLQKYNFALERKTGIQTGELNALQGTLSAMGLHNKQLAAATKATLGLQKVTGQGLNEAAKVVAKVFKGNTTALQEYGIKVQSAAEGQEYLANTFRLVEAQANTMETQLAILRASTDGMLDRFGRWVSESPALFAAISSVVPMMDAFGRHIDSMSSSIDGGVKAFAWLAGNASILARALWASAVAPLKTIGVVVTTIFSMIKNRSADFKRFYSEASDDADAIVDKFTGGDVADQFAFQMEKIANAQKAAKQSFDDTGKTVKKVAADDWAEFVKKLNESSDAANRSAMAARILDEAFNKAPWHEATNGINAMAKSLWDLQQASSFETTGTPEAVDAFLAMEQKKREVAWETTEQRIKAETAAEKATKDYWKDLMAQIHSGGSQVMAGFVTSIASGDNVIESFKQFSVGILKQIGTILIGAGTAAVLLSALGAIPILKPLVGESAISATAGAALIAAGAAMVAGGSILGGVLGVGRGASQPPISAPQAAERASGGGPVQPRDVRSNAPNSLATPSQTVVINLNGPVGGSPRRIGRDLAGYINRYSTLGAT